MIAAFVEWILFLAAFDYCLWQAYRKAEHQSTRILTVFISFGFTALR